MDTLLARYLDGELSDNEARAFQALLQTSPALAEELRATEAALDVYADARFRRPGRAFVSRVMEALPPAAVPDRAAARGRARPGRWALAATVVLCLGLGWTAGRYLPAAGPTAPVAVATADATRRVRLVHVPGDPGVEAVAVAGDFNGWDPEAAPMHRQGEAWVVWLALPPDVYEYVFVEEAGGDRRRCLPDPLAAQTRDDGFGGRNAVLDLSL